MKNSQQGMVLIIVLIFLEIFFILELYAVQSNTVEMKLARNYWEKHIISSAADAVLRRLEDGLVESEGQCEIPLVSVAFLIHQPLSWWQRVSCSGEFEQYHYYSVVERLGVDACAVIRNVDAKAEYFRLSVLLVTEDGGVARVIMQSVVARAGHSQESCQEQGHVVQLGRQSWLGLV